MERAEFETAGQATNRSRTRGDNAVPARGTTGVRPSLPGPFEQALLPDRYFSTRLRQLAQLDVDEATAETLWRESARHRRELHRQLARDVGQRVALLDYIANIDADTRAHRLLLQSEPRPITDPLTGLFSETYFQPRLMREFDRSVRSGVPLSLLLVGLDDFAELINDHGADTGDRVLQRVGTVVLHQLRAADVPCRSGPDEFGLILPATPAYEAGRIASRIGLEIAVRFRRDAVNGRQIRVHSVTGLASADEAQSLDELLVAARESLESARRASESSRPNGPALLERSLLLQRNGHGTNGAYS